MILYFIIYAVTLEITFIAQVLGEQLAQSSVFRLYSCGQPEVDEQLAPLYILISVPHHMRPPEVDEQLAPLYFLISIPHHMRPP